MADRLIVPPGSKVIIELDEETGDISEEAVSTQGEAPTMGTLAFGAIPPPDNLFRRPDIGGFSFYDLGTRWAEGGYIYKMFPQPVNFENDYSSFFLEDSPFDKTDGHTNCLRLPFGAEWLYLDATFKKGGESKKYVLGRNNKRAFLTDLGGDAPPVDNPRTAWVVPGVLNTPSAVGADWGVQIQSGFYYNAFDTSDIGIGGRYKITNLPSRIAPSVEFKLPQGGASVYLIPTCVTEWLYNRSVQQAECFGAKRFPILPDFSLQANPFTLTGGIRTTQGGITSAFTTPEFRAALIEFFGDVIFTFIEPPAPGATPFSLETATRIDAEVPFGNTLLAAVIVVDKKIFYIWHQNSSGFACDIDLLRF